MRFCLVGKLGTQHREEVNTTIDDHLDMWQNCNKINFEQALSKQPTR